MRSTPWLPALAAAFAAVPPGAAAAPPTDGAPTVPITVPAAEPPTAGQRALTLPQALELALSANRELAAARREVEAFGAAREQAAARPNPQLELALEGTRRFERETTLQLAQPIELGGKRGARTAAAGFAEEAARQRLLARTADIGGRIALAFHEALAAQERVRVAATSTTAAETLTGVAAQRVAAGKAAPIEATRARVAEAQARLEQAQAQGQLRTALARLAGSIGASEPDGANGANSANSANGANGANGASSTNSTGGTGAWRIAAVEGVLAPPPLPDEQALQRLLKDAPTLRQAALEADRQTALAQLARAQRMPDLTLAVGARRDDATGRSRAIVGLSLPLPLFDTRRPAENEALHRAQQARDEAAAAAALLESQVAQAAEKLRGADLELRTLERDLLPGAQEAHRAALRGFELGKFGLAESLDAQRTWAQIQMQRLRALVDAHAAAAELQRLLGATYEAR